MSGFVEKLFDSFTNNDNNQENQQQQQQPQLPHPWTSQWDDREQRYIYINESTGERSWTPPQQGQSDDFSQDAAEWTGRRVGEAENVGQDVEQGFDRFGDGVERRFDNTVENIEDAPERVEQNFDEFGDGVERRFDDAVEDVEDAPERVEQSFDRFGDGVERRFDDAVEDVQDAPEEVAGWTGERVGDVQRFGDEVEGYGDGLGNAYDQGRQEGRDDY
jgi:hypothetical protein